MSHGEQQWARATFVSLAAVVLALLVALGPVVANASAIPVSTGGVLVMHNELLGTDPPYDAHLGAGPARITLTFDLPAQSGFSTLIVTGPDHKQWQSGPATEQGTTVSAAVRPLGPAGEYTVAWRIISADGHPVRGTFPFTLTTPGPGTAAAPPPNADLSGSATTGSAGASWWPWLAGAGALLIAGVVMTRRISRTRS